MKQRPHILAFATKGAGSNEEVRLGELLREYSPQIVPFDRADKLRSHRSLLRQIKQTRPDLVVMEGTGVAGGMACVLGRLLYGVPYVFSSGDAVGPWVGMRARPAGVAFGMYERLLCRCSAGFIGWTPYLVGRALSFGAPRAMTAAGWAEFNLSPDAQADARVRVRQELGIAPDALVFGIVGALIWADRFQYCYGMELLRAIQRARRPGAVALIAGGGSGYTQLRRLARRDLGSRIFLPGEIPPQRVPEFLAAMDIGSLPQSVDAVGSFRYTTKISEYIAARLPLATGEIPLSYDLPHDWMWRLPGSAPWDGTYISALVDLIESVTPQEIECKRRAVPDDFREFDRQTQVNRATEFVDDILKRTGGRPTTLNRPSISIRHAVPGRPRRLLSIAHSYVVALNRRLVQEMIQQSNGRWNVTAAAPDYFHGAQDLRPLEFERSANESFRVEVVPTHLSRFVHVFSYGHQLKRLLKEGWDFVHAWEEPYIWAGNQIARWTPQDTPIVYRTAQSLNKRYPPPFNWIERFDMRRASGWICSGTLVAQTLGARPLYSRRPMRLIPLGVDADRFAPNPAAGAELLRKLNWKPGDAPVVGFLGRFTRPKGLQLLMDVLENLGMPWRALFVGAGPMECELRAWARRFGDRVRICNDVRHADVPAYLNAMDVLAAPSQTTHDWREQFGRMLIEAFACGVPVIGSDSGEIPFVIQSTGVICPERDHAAWTSALRELLSNSERRHELAEAARARVHDEFAWPAIARQHLDFFDELL